MRPPHARLPKTTVDKTILDAIAAGAVIAFSLSAGKDSAVAADAANALLDELGHPRKDRIAIHADLGRIEWKSTPETAEKTAERLGVPLVVVRHSTHDMVSRWEARFANGKRRYANLEVFNLIGPWSSAALRFCTAEMKQQVISPALQKLYPGRTIISVIGIRRQESPARSKAETSKPEPRWDKRDGTRLLSWHPILDLTTDEVFARHKERDLPLHEAYTVYGSTRLSCAFCIMGSLNDQKASASAEQNHDVYRHLVDLEVKSTFSFQPERWLGDLRPELLSLGLQVDLGQAKARAVRRRELEAALPAGLRYVKGWPPREPTYDEAVQIVAARETILATHELDVIYPTPRSVIERFQELMARNRPQPLAP